MEIRKHMNLLGMKVVDRVTGFRGVVTSISFDLYGCIQAVVTPGSNKDGTQGEAHWHDVNRLRVTGKKPVMPRPDWDFGPVAEGKKGPAEKPPFRSM